MPVSVLAMLILVLPVIAVVTLLHILDWVKQELCVLVDEAAGWDGVDMLLDWDKSENRESCTDCSWIVFTHNYITARLA